MADPNVYPHYPTVVISREVENPQYDEATDTLTVPPDLEVYAKLYPDRMKRVAQFASTIGEQFQEAAEKEVEKFWESLRCQNEPVKNKPSLSPFIYLPPA